MSIFPIYVLDTSVFVTAANNYYAFDLVPGFWECLKKEANNGKLISIDRVYDELLQGNDQLAKWTEQEFKSYFDSTNDNKIITEYKQVILWVTQQTQYNNGAKADFAQEYRADAWLVAYTKAKEAILVTCEKPDPLIKRMVPIPNACNALGITYTDTFAMLRQLGIKLTHSY